jgi:hypothetical protein
MHRSTNPVLVGLCLFLATLAMGGPPEMDGPAGKAAAEPTGSSQEERTLLHIDPDINENSSRADLWNELVKTAIAASELRQELSRARMKTMQIERELDALRQFILDHEEFGPDYEEYEKIRSIAEREARLRSARERRAKLDTQRKLRLSEVERRRDLQEAVRLEEEQDKHYAQAGFGPIGLDIYLGRSSYFYAPMDVSQSQVIYNPSIPSTGNTSTETEINYSEMTISGSFLNASAETRNVGIAITFFDEHGNQVGAEIIQVENARSNVPYPFTSKIKMALNRPFSTHSSYVLYADPVQ